MLGKYENNPILDLYMAMHRELLNRNISESSENIDDIFKLILLNNGCKISMDNTPKQTVIDIISNKYKICFITGMIGNDANEYYDFITFNGMKYLIIFLDYFNIITEEDINNSIDNVENSLKIMLGNSVYYDAIKKIVEVFYLTFEPIPNGLLTTAMATNQRWNQVIIAIHLLNEFKPVDENDVSDISIEDIKKILSGSIECQLYGIRAM